MSRCFYWLMQRAGFPYRDCQLTNKLDCLLLQHLKETFCHLDQVRRGKLCIIQVNFFPLENFTLESLFVQVDC